MTDLGKRILGREGVAPETRMYLLNRTERVIKQRNRRVTVDPGGQVPSQRPPAPEQRRSQQFTHCFACLMSS